MTRRAGIAAVVVALLGIAGVSVPNLAKVATPEPAVAQLPEQTPGRGRWWTLGDHRLDELAEFAVTARVLGVRRYTLDRGARVSPFDMALGWGPMSAPHAANALNVHQQARWYWLSWRSHARLGPSEMLRYSANVHMIPATTRVRDALRDIEVGEIRHFRGHLVSVSGSDGFRWVSSLSREDTGDGACELFLVTEVWDLPTSL